MDEIFQLLGRSETIDRPELPDGQRLGTPQWEKPGSGKRDQVELVQEGNAQVNVKVHANDEARTIEMIKFA